jgi:ATP-binding cassette subfamily B (MDR/TAP) protein 1
MQRVTLNIPSFDKLMVFLGTVGGCANGVVLPSFSLVFGQLIDAFNKPGSEMLHEITKIALYFTYIGVGALLVNWGELKYCDVLIFVAQSTCWNLVATRNTKRIREEFMKAIMRQEIGWFDQNQTGELITRMSG